MKLVLEKIKSVLNDRSDTEIAFLSELEHCNNTVFPEKDLKIRVREMVLRHTGVRHLSVRKEILEKNYRI